MQIRFAPVRFGEGYDMAEVDDLIDRCERDLRARDGSVTAEVQGEPSHLGAFFSRLLEEMGVRGVRSSYTIDQRDEIAVVPGERGFEVRY